MFEQVIPAMSSASPIGADRLIESVGIDAETLQSTVVAPFRFVGFWSAVVLPFAYLPLLFTDLQGATLTAFVALLVVHVVSIVLGREYKN